MRTRLEGDRKQPWVVHCQNKGKNNTLKIKAPVDETKIQPAKCTLGAQSRSQHQKEISCKTIWAHGCRTSRCHCHCQREVKVKLMLNAAHRTGPNGCLREQESLGLHCIDFLLFASQHVTYGLKSFRRQTVLLSEFFKYNKSKQNNSKKQGSSILHNTSHLLQQLFAAQQ